MGAVGAARENLDDLDRRVTALEHDIGACACLSPAELDDWSSWRAGAREYLREASDRVSGLQNALNAASVAGMIAVGAAEVWTDREAADVDRRTGAYSAELATWQQRAASKGATLTTPGAPPAFALPWTTIGVVALVAVGLGAGAWYVYRPRTANRAPRKNPSEADWARDAAAEIAYYHRTREARGGGPRALDAGARAHLAQLKRELAAYRRRRLAS
jgi:hypothetical protein